MPAVASAGVAIAVHPSPWGPIHVAVTGEAVVGLEMRTTSDAFAEAVGRRLRSPVEERAATMTLDRLRRELDEYAAGRRDRFEVAVALVGVSDWDRSVLEGVRRIGHGEVTSYGRLAAMIGRRGAARAVGGAVGRNPIGLLIPCHRVIAGDGSIGGYGGSWFGTRDELLELKRSLLAHEGVEIPAARLVA
jgi:methylated-DNA-[protein]-cysteine S-methyltransferase